MWCVHRRREIASRESITTAAKGVLLAKATPLGRKNARKGVEYQEVLCFLRHGETIFHGVCTWPQVNRATSNVRNHLLHCKSEVPLQGSGRGVHLLSLLESLHQSRRGILRQRVPYRIYMKHHENNAHVD